MIAISFTLLSLVIRGPAVVFDRSAISGRRRVDAAGGY